MAKLQFRAATWAQLFTTVLAAFIHVTILLAFYRHGHAGAKMTAPQAVSYVWLVHVLLHLLPGMGVDQEIKEKIRSGDVAVELCRPLDLYAHWFARSLASRIAPFLLAFLPVTLVACLAPEPYRLQPPSSPLGLVAAFLALTLGLLITAATMCITYAVLMKVSWGDGPIYIMAACTDLLTGANLPLELWPGWLQRLLYWQPFAGILDLPLRLYVGTLPPSAFWQVAPIQCGWALVLILLGAAMLQRNLVKLVLQGG